MRRQDAQVGSVLEAVCRPVLRTPWRIDPAGARDEVVEFCADDLGLPIVGENPKPPPRSKDRFSWTEHLELALLMLPFGHMYFEAIYRVTDDGSRAHLGKLEPRMPRTIEQIDVARDGGLISITQYNLYGSTQKPIPVDRLVAYIYKREGANWLGRSILRQAYKNWLIKDRLLRVQAQTIERNGMGIPLYKAAENGTDAQKAEGLAMAKAWRAGEAAGSAVPFGADLILRGVEGDLPDALPAIKYHDEQIARAVLAHFLNLDNQSHGSYALGTSFMDFFTLSLQTLAQSVADVASMHIVEDLVDVNWGPEEPAPRIVFDEIGSRQAATAQSVKTLVDAGIITPDERLEESSRQQYGLPPADPETARDGGPKALTPSGGPITAGSSPPLTPTAVAAAAKFNPDLHPRGAEGRFRTTLDRIVAGLRKWAEGGGKGDPFEGFTREQLRRTAVARGIKLRRGASGHEIRDHLLVNLRDALAGDEGPNPVKKAAKKAAPKAEASVGIDLDKLRSLDDPEAIRDALDLHKVPELKEALRQQKLPLSGRKRELVDRLVEHLAPTRDGDQGDAGLTDEGQTALERLSATGDPKRGLPADAFRPGEDIEGLRVRGLVERLGQGRQTRYRITSKGEKALSVIYAARRDDRPFPHFGEQMTPDQARARQAEIDSKRKVADTLTEVQALVGTEADSDVLRRRITAAAKANGLDDSTRDALLHAVDEARQVEVENKVRAAFSAIKARPVTPDSNVDLRRSGWVRLADLRNELGESINRHELDDALRRLAAQQHGSIIPESAQWLLRPEDRDAELVVGGQRKHWLQIDDPSPRPNPLTETVQRLARDAGLTPVAQPGQVVPFDRKLHESVFGTPRVGEKVGVDEAGYSVTLSNGETVALSKAKVSTYDPKLHGPEPTRSGGGLPSYAPPASLTAAEQDRAARLVRSDPQIFATLHERYGGISTSGNLSPEDAAWLQSVFEREPAFVNRLAQTEQIQRRLREQAKKADQTPAAYRAEVAGRLKELLADKPVVVRVSDEAALRGILTEGRFRTQFDPGTKRAPGLTGDSGRRRLGEEIAGVAPDTPADRRPVYGYVAIGGIEPALEAGKKIPGIAQREGQEDILSTYGRVQVVLKPEVRARTTATVGDSLDEIGFLRPSPIDAPTAESLGTRNLDSIAAPGWTRTGYVEAQVHGGVSAADIAEVVFPVQPSAETVARLDSQGIPWRVLSTTPEVAKTPRKRAPKKAVRAAAGHDITPGHDELHHYWTVGEGLAKWAESPTPWTTLYHHLLKYMNEAMAKRAASRWFIEVFHYAVGSDKNRVAHGKPPRGKRIGPG